MYEAGLVEDAECSYDSEHGGPMPISYTPLPLIINPQP